MRNGPIGLAPAIAKDEGCLGLSLNARATQVDFLKFRCHVACKKAIGATYKAVKCAFEGWHIVQGGAPEAQDLLEYIARHINYT